MAIETSGMGVRSSRTPEAALTELLRVVRGQIARHAPGWTRLAYALNQYERAVAQAAAEVQHG